MNLSKVLLELGRGVVHPFAQTGTALAYTPKAVYREVQGKPIDDIQRRVFGTNDQGAIARNIIGNTAQVGLSLAIPAYKGASVLQGAKYGAGLGAAGGVASGFADTGKAEDMLTRGLTGGALGGLIGGATPLARALYLRGRTPGFNVTNGMDATFGPKPEFQIKAGVPLQNNPLKKGFEIVDNNPQPFKIVDNSAPRQLSGAAQQSHMGKYISSVPVEDTNAIERTMVGSYIKGKPAVTGNALTGEGAKLPSDIPLSPLARAKAITEARAKTGKILNTGDKIVDSNPKTQIVKMSPDEYLKQAFGATDGKLGGSYDSWLKSNRHDPQIAAKYAEAMKRGDKFPTPFIDNARGMQDGRNRALAAKLAGKKTIDVAVVPKLTPKENVAFYQAELNKATSPYMKYTLQQRLDAAKKEMGKSSTKRK